MIDNHALRSGNNTTSSARRSIAIDISSTDWVIGANEYLPTHIWVNTGGTLEVHLVDDPADTTITVTVPDGFYFIGQVDKVIRSGTTASGLIGLSP